MAQRASVCRDCVYVRHCGGFRDRMGRCPEWAHSMRVKPLPVGATVTEEVKERWQKIASS